MENTIYTARAGLLTLPRDTQRTRDATHVRTDAGLDGPAFIQTMIKTASPGSGNRELLPRLAAADLHQSPPLSEKQKLMTSTDLTHESLVNRRKTVVSYTLESFLELRTYYSSWHQTLQGKEKVFIQLMTCIAFGWQDRLPELLLSAHPAQSSPVDWTWWAEILESAFWHAHKSAISCLLEFFLRGPRTASGGTLHARVDPRVDEAGRTILHHLAGKGVWQERGDLRMDLPPDVFDILRSFYVAPEFSMIRDESRKTPLHEALLGSHLALSQSLVLWTPERSREKLINCTDINRQSPLHILCNERAFACRVEHHIELLNLFLAYCPNLDAQNDMGETPLHMASQGRSHELVNALRSRIRSRQQLHCVDIQGRTPLMCATTSNVIMEFSPWQRNSTWLPVSDVCKLYPAPLVEWKGGRFHSFTYCSIRKLLYERADETISQKVPKGHLKWIHLPANNIDWCEDFLTRWYSEGAGNLDKEGLKAARRVFDLQHVAHSKQGRFLQPGVQIVHPDYDSRNGDQQEAPKRRHIFIAAPYLHFETKSNVDRMKTSLHGPPVGDSLEESLYSSYAQDPGFHPRRTLDQYVYHNLNTNTRDLDQVIQKVQRGYYAHLADGCVVEDVRGNASATSLSQDKSTTLMVDQLWIWMLGDDLVLTCFPERWNRPEQDPYDVLKSLLATIGRGRGPKTAGDLALLSMMQCFGTFDRHARTMPKLQALSMFEQAIGEIGAAEGNLLKKFAKAYQTLKANTTAARQNPESNISCDEIATLNDLTLETTLLTELKDIRDELGVISTVIGDQQRIVRELSNVETKLVQAKLPPLCSTSSTSAQTPDGSDVFESVNAIINQSLQDVARLDSQAARFSQSLSELLQLKQAHSNAFELTFSRNLSLDAAKQGRAVLVFTIVTIIFSPLSLVAAFFTMDLTNLPRDLHGKSTLNLSFVSARVFGIGFAVALPCIFLAFSVRQIQSVWTQILGYARNWPTAQNEIATKSKRTPEEGPLGHTRYSTSSEQHSISTELPSSGEAPKDAPISATQSATPTGLKNIRQRLGAKLGRKWRDRPLSEPVDAFILPR
ncbi:hypothetical protein Q7P37_008684 [Cladosporium fusiforme]